MKPQQAGLAGSWPTQVSAGKVVLCRGNCEFESKGREAQRTRAAHIEPSKPTVRLTLEAGHEHSEQRGRASDRR